MATNQQMMIKTKIEKLIVVYELYIKSVVGSLEHEQSHIYLSDEERIKRNEAVNSINMVITDLKKAIR